MRFHAGEKRMLFWTFAFLDDVLANAWVSRESAFQYLVTVFNAPVCATNRRSLGRGGSQRVNSIPASGPITNLGLSTTKRPQHMERPLPQRRSD